jgi:hypothetical protein
MEEGKKAASLKGKRGRLRLLDENLDVHADVC